MAAKPVSPTPAVEDTHFAIELQLNRPLLEGEGSIVAEGGAPEVTPSAVALPQPSGQMPSAYSAAGNLRARWGAADSVGSKRQFGSEVGSPSEPRSGDWEDFDTQSLTGWGDPRPLQRTT
jgi:hypothetical protein